MLKTPLDRLRFVGWFEGASFLLLLGVAMPLKYLAGMPQMVSVVGMLHGILFMLFLAAVVETAIALRWSPARVLVAVAASMVPFGPFILDARLRREYAPRVQSSGPR